MTEVIIRKIKEMFQKTVVQWVIVVGFFLLVALLGLYLFINDVEQEKGNEDTITVEEQREKQLQGEVDEVLKNR